ncbi:unnamed protein product [Moneuplotes crassus]|uniref:Potassium channel domain-containing protein n=1 Tax=Euplotes crassus TaxID=5936 RepID=A0AAD1XEJ1_EUPCR|nr:unnamed protein product [Moneuplotes crassus]
MRKSIDAFAKSNKNTSQDINVDNIDNSADLDQVMKSSIDDTLAKENIFISNEYGIKLLACENFQSFLTLLHVGNSIVIYEITSDSSNHEMDRDIVLQLYISTFSCILLICMLFIRYWLEVKWHKAKNLSANIWIPLAVELAITTVGPQVFLKDVTYSEYVYDYDISVTYPVNNLLCCFVWVKLYVPIRTFLMTNKYTTPRAQRVCFLNGCNADLTFSFRSKFKESPNSILVTAFILSSLVCAYMLRIFERPLSEVSEQDFNPVWTAIWCVFVTMTTVGYGDVYPKSYGGRLLGVFMCLWGVLLVSLFVVTISDILEFDQSEKNSYILIKRLVYKEELRKSAAKLIVSKIIRLRQSKFEVKNTTDVKTNFLFRRHMLTFKRKKLEKRQFEDSNELIFLFKNADDIGEMLEEIEAKQKKLKKNQIKIFAAIKLFTDIAEHLENEENEV